MRNSPALSRWDAAVATYLSSRHALGRAFCKEETVLCHLRAFLARRGARAVDQPLFDQWRRQFSHLSASTRLGPPAVAAEVVDRDLAHDPTPFQR